MTDDDRATAEAPTQEESDAVVARLAAMSNAISAEFRVLAQTYPSYVATISLDLPQDLHEQLQARADLAGTSLEDYLRAWLIINAIPLKPS
jgi:hypothetical protein